MWSRHPWQALTFIYATDLAALGLLLVQWPTYAQFTVTEWLSAAMFALIMSAARIMPIQSVDATRIGYGWYMAVEFAMIASLPVPLACLAHLPSIPVWMLYCKKKKKPEWYLGADYTGAVSIICAFAAGHAYQWMIGLPTDAAPWLTLMLLPVAAVFMTIQYGTLTLLVCLDQRVPWNKTGLYCVDSMIADVVMTLLGALIGRLYVLDRTTILLTIVPVVLLQRTLERLQEAKLANVDSKTGLYNYRYLDTALSEEVRRATQTGRPLTLIFGDMDYLRDINNTYGHLAGDRALRGVAKVFKRNARAGDVPARFGGEEFVLLLPATEKEQAWEAAEKIRREVAAQRLETGDGGAFSVTISLGLASFPQDAKTVQGLIKAADEAVYKAKHGGRNRVCAYHSGVAI